jgi:hypothetical protein
MKKQVYSAAWCLLALGLVLLAMLAAARHFSSGFRPAYQPQTILTSPNGACALVEYNFRGGERGYWSDPYRMILLLEGDAFFTVTELRSGKIVRDSSAEITTLPAYSLASAGMGKDVFYWGKDGRTAAFPGGEGPFHEWTGIHECTGAKAAAEFADLSCYADSHDAACTNIRAKLTK